MEARASLSSGALVSRTFVGVVLVLVAMGLAAMGGYMARTFSGGGAATVTQSGDVHAAPGTVLRQDNPTHAGAELPGWAQREIAQPTAPAVKVDDPAFISQYYAAPATHQAGRGYQELD